MAASSTGDWASESENWMYQSYIHKSPVSPTVPRSLIRCKHCGVKNEWDEPFCTSCGAPLPDANETKNHQTGKVIYTEYKEPEGLIAKIKASLFGK